MPQPRRIPLAVKLLYTAFVAVMIPKYWHEYGPQNFLFFCDIALLITLVGIWTESALLISMQAVGILFPQLLWILDFLVHALGFHLIGMTDYMFNPRYDLFLRGISLFHAWMPLLLVWLVYRLGYDRRALVYQSILGVLVLLICYVGFVPPGTVGSKRMAVNINFVFGFSDSTAQTTMPPLVWLAMFIVGIPVLVYWPAHRMLCRAIAKRKSVTEQVVAGQA